MRLPSPRFGLLASALLAAPLAFSATPDDGLIPPEDGTFAGHRLGEAPDAPWTTLSVVAPSSIKVIREAQSPFPSQNPSADGISAGVLWEDADNTSWGPILSRRLDSLTEADGVVRWSFDYLVPIDSTRSSAMAYLSFGAGDSSRAGPVLHLCREPGRLMLNNGNEMVDAAATPLGTWHRVEVTIRLSEKTYDVALQRWNGRRLVVARDLSFRGQEALPLRYFNLADGSREESAGSGVFIDNISLTRSAPAAP